MTNNDMRQLMNVVESKPIELDEGIIDTIKGWFKRLGDPIKNQTKEFLNDLSSLLVSRYGQSVPNQVKSNNKTWMFGKLTYGYLYNFCRHIGFTDVEIERALKNRIVTNTLNRASALLPNNVPKPVTPLTIESMRNNPNVISTMVDSKTKVYLSKLIAEIILESLAYIHAENEKLAAIKSKATPVSYTQHTPYVDEPAQATAAAPAGPTQNELKAALINIKQGLASIKGGKE